MRRSHCLMLVLLAAGCVPLDPYDRPQTWAPTGANDTNLRVMVTNPNDLTIGQESHGSVSAEAAPAVKRLLAGNRAPLPNSNAAKVGDVPAAGQPPVPPAVIPQ